MDTAKFFWSGRSQAVHLPKDYRFESAQVRIRRRGRTLILEPIAQDWKCFKGVIGSAAVAFGARQPKNPEAGEAQIEGPVPVKYLLDANAVIGLLKGQKRFLVRRRRPEQFAMSSTVVHESDQKDAPRPDRHRFGR